MTYGDQELPASWGPPPDRFGGMRPKLGGLPSGEGPIQMPPRSPWRGGPSMPMLGGLPGGLQETPPLASRSPWTGNELPQLQQGVGSMGQPGPVQQRPQFGRLAMMNRGMPQRRQLGNMGRSGMGRPMMGRGGYA